MKTALLALVLLSTVAHADSLKPVAIGLHIGSHHFTERQTGSWNNSNPGVYARWENGLTVGTLYNSERRQSAYVAWTWESQQWNRLSVALTAGAITGYAKTVSPLLSVSGSFAITERASVRLSLMPKAHPAGSAVAHLSTEWSF
jgi:hypothetical protein